MYSFVGAGCLSDPELPKLRLRQAKLHTNATVTCHQPLAPGRDIDEASGNLRFASVITWSLRDKLQEQNAQRRIYD